MGRRFLQPTPFKIAIASTLFVFILYLLSYEIPSFTLLQTFENKLLDARFKARGTLTPDNKVVIVAIDEKSIEDPSLGRWPWPRSKIADFINISLKCN